MCQRHGLARDTSALGGFTESDRCSALDSVAEPSEPRPFGVTFVDENENENGNYLPVVQQNRTIQNGNNFMNKN